MNNLVKAIFLDPRCAHTMPTADLCVARQYLVDRLASEEFTKTLSAFTDSWQVRARREYKSKIELIDLVLDDRSFEGSN